MNHKIEYVKLEDDETSEIVLQINITRYKESNKIKFDILKIPLNNGEERYLKDFIEKTVINGNWDKKISKEEIEEFKNKFNKK